ncbi:MAG: NADH-quinone oxidoreductase subunit 5 family protein [Endomicrobiales bacterium]
MDTILFAPIAVPAVAGLLALVVPNKARGVRETIALLATIFNLVLAAFLFNQDLGYTVSWGGLSLDFSLRLYHFSGFIVLAAAGFSFLVVLYSTVFMSGKKLAGQFYAYLLISAALVNGAVLADNLVAMLFFWEGLLLTLFGMIVIGHKGAYKTAVKAFIISGVADLCMMIGVGLTYYLSGTLTISQIHLPLTTPLANVAFIFMMTGAIAKAGSMPFHSWIPDAAVDAPLPFMAFLPASLEKLLGIYFLARITLDLFQMSAGSWVSVLLMVIGAVTILLAVMMALVQKDFKRLLSYHAISQVGYMILGVGTGVPAGIVGGLFHMINHAMYKSCLFLTGGAVEKQAGTTDLAKLGGLGRYMPVSFVCFIVAAASISGVPPFNGFFSKELVYDGALERHWIFYAAALLGSFFTAASFLKLGHAAFLGKPSAEHRNVKEAPVAMLVPMIVIASFCILFGVYNALPLNTLIQPILGARLEGHNYAGFPFSALLVIMTVLVLIAAYLNHLYGTRKTGSGLGAADHIHHAPVLQRTYDLAEKRFFDPYDIGLRLVGLGATAAWYIDRGINWIYDAFSVRTAYAVSNGIRRAHTGDYSLYLLWSLAGLVVIVLYFVG